MGELSITSLLASAPEAIWAHVVRPTSLNREFAPLLRMTFPAGLEDLTTAGPLGECHFRSWLLFAGVLPVEFDDVVFVEVEPGRRFLERSSMATQRVWEHERIIEAVEGGARVTDRVRYEPRLRLLGPLLRPIFVGTFFWRHYKLRRIFGALPAQSSSG